MFGFYFPPQWMLVGSDWLLGLVSSCSRMWVVLLQETEMAVDAGAVPNASLALIR